MNVTYIVVLLALIVLLLLFIAIVLFKIFKRLDNQVDWTLVYPELAGLGEFDDEAIPASRHTDKEYKEPEQEELFSEPESMSVDEFKEETTAAAEEEAVEEKPIHPAPEPDSLNVKETHEFQIKEILKRAKKKEIKRKETEKLPDKNLLDYSEYLNELRKDKEKIQEPADIVNTTAYAPKKVQHDKEFQITVFAHLYEQKKEVDEEAKQLEEEATKKAFKTLDLKIPRGKKLQFHLQSEELVIEDDIQELTWWGQPDYCNFYVSLKSMEIKNAKVKIVVIYEGVPVGLLRFRIAANQEGEQNIGYSDITAQKFKYAFISYASENRNEVLKRTQMLKMAGIDFFQDVLSLDPGDRWERELYKNIDLCDVFFLFWTTAAKKSPWVTKEWQYALDINHRTNNSTPHIIPVPIEGPPIPKAPDELSKIHFMDSILYSIK